MFFLYLLSILSLIVQAIFVTLAIAAGLFYLAELVEEYTVMAKYVISWIVVMTATIHIGLILFEEIPLYFNVLGLIQQVLHGVLLREFPVVRVMSVTFITGVANLVLHHYLAFKYFGNVFFTFSEVYGEALAIFCMDTLLTYLLFLQMLIFTKSIQYISYTYFVAGEVLAYFTLCLWVVPFALFVSLSANDYVLPTTGERMNLLDDDNVVTDYLSRKAKRYSLLSFFSLAKESILPQRNKKAF